MKTVDRKSWASDGVVTLENYLQLDVIESLQSEAEQLRPAAIEHSIDSVEERRDGSFASPSRFRVHRGGPALTALHRDLQFLSLVRKVTGLDRLIPVRCSYNFYSPEHFMGVHRDEIRATVTATFTLTEGLSPTKYIPQSRAWTNDKITEIVATDGYLPPNGEEMPLPMGNINLFDGYNIAHWRPPVVENSILGNLVYFRL